MPEAMGLNGNVEFFFFFFFLSFFCSDGEAGVGDGGVINKKRDRAAIYRYLLYPSVCNSPRGIPLSYTQLFAEDRKIG